MKFLNIPKQKTLQKLFTVDANGNVFWKIRIANRIKIGNKAGRLNSKGYLIVGINGKVFQLHRLLYVYYYGNVDISKNDIDHKDGNKLNNIKENLRLASSSDNCKNCKKNIKNTSGCKGISFRKDINKWSVYINIDKKRKHLGNFSNFIYACVVRKRAEKKYYKQWRCNR